MTKKYNTVILIGRFQPLHKAHVAMINRAKELARYVIVLIGSSNKPRTYKDPFSYSERRDMIINAVGDRVECFPLVDCLYNDNAWAKSVQEIVVDNTLTNEKIAIIGHKKDDSSFYLDMFPQWEFVDFPLSTELHATDIRDIYFRETVNFDYLEHVVPGTTMNALRAFSISPAFKEIIAERNFETEYKKQYSGLKYPPIFVTADAVVVQSGHILLIRRRSLPGKGLWALPGGFVNANTDKSVQAAMIRELREETKLKVPTLVLLGSIKNSKVFDAVNRSGRGRIITHAFNIVLSAGPLPPVKGSDDAEKAQWIPISDLKSSNMFEDHFEIINYFLGA